MIFNLKLFPLIFIISSTFSTLTSLFQDNLTISCRFSFDEFKVVGEIYTCESENFLITPINATTTLTAIFNTSNHLQGFINSKVKGFKVDGHLLKLFPKSIEKTFTNLTAIYINDGILSKITQSDLKPFPLLRYLDLFSNHIEVIEENLFEFNKNLEVIWLSDNKILKIHPNVFDNLLKLSHLYLNENLCIAMSELNRTEVLKLIREVKSSCGGQKIITNSTEQFKSYSEIQREFVETSGKLKTCEENLDDVHSLMEFVDLANEIKNHHFDEMKSELKSAGMKNKVLGFFVAILTLALIGLGIVLFRGKNRDTNGGYARGFMF